MSSAQPNILALLSLPRWALFRIMRQLEERDQAVIAATCRKGLKIARQVSLCTAVRFRNLQRRVVGAAKGSSGLFGGVRLIVVGCAVPLARGPSPIYRLSLEVLGVIMEIAGPQTMIGFAGTCRAFRKAFLHHMHSMTFRAMNEFGIPPREFMHALLMTSSIVAGSVAVNVITGSRFKPSAFDVVTPASEEHSMLAILGQTIGCVLVRTSVPIGMQGTLRMLYEFEHGGRIVRLWIAAGENPTVPVMLTDTTFVMNFISPWGIYCAYPNLTLKRRGLINHFTYSDDDENGTAKFSGISSSFFKYAARGVAFEIDDRSWADAANKHRCFTSATCPHTIRSLYDTSGLYLSFPIEYDGVPYHIAQNTRLDGKYTTIWSLGGGYCNEPQRYHAAFSQSKNLYILVRRV
jgi:hypothetical protein